MYQRAFTILEFLILNIIAELLNYRGQVFLICHCHLLMFFLL